MSFVIITLIVIAGIGLVTWVVISTRETRKQQRTAGTYMKNSGPWFRLKNLWSEIFTPGYSHCLRCKGKWNVVKPHNTKEDDHLGCFPLCQTCWLELKTPEARLPFYHKLVFEYWTDYDHHRWPAIKAAVLMGR